MLAGVDPQGGNQVLQRVKSLIRDIPDFPKPGIVFKDITPLLSNGKAFGEVIGLMAELGKKHAPDCVVAVESRGFIFGAALAAHMGVGFVPVRKPGKLPYRTSRVEYALEYGTDSLEIHSDALGKGARALVVDDVLATGGTAAATIRLVEQQGAIALACLFFIELSFLGGRSKLGSCGVDALLHY
ncbi:MAG: adenine phosphoribosyltransferase [Deltaproteobacteria bacterium]|nr:adenine phosphoribosyltransferase [Deltaproteobacteria bacterium]